MRWQPKPLSPEFLQFWRQKNFVYDVCYFLFFSFFALFLFLFIIWGWKKGQSWYEYFVLSDLLLCYCFEEFEITRNFSIVLIVLSAKILREVELNPLWKFIEYFYWAILVVSSRSNCLLMLLNLVAVGCRLTILASALDICFELDSWCLI